MCDGLSESAAELDSQCLHAGAALGILTLRTDRSLETFVQPLEAMHIGNVTVPKFLSHNRFGCSRAPSPRVFELASAVQPSEPTVVPRRSRVFRQLSALRYCRRFRNRDGGCS